MHILTYATDERYLPSKESFPDIVLLGVGKQWNGFDKIKAVLAYCKQHPREIICFINDSVVLSSPQEIINKFESYQTPLIMSHGLTTNIISKYIQDKVGKCNDESLNPEMFIGTSEAILSFWKDFKSGQNVKWYATQKCKHYDMKIDVKHEIFYTYSPNDDIREIDNRFYVNDVATCIIGLSGIYESERFTFLPEVGLFFIISIVLMKCRLPLSFVISFLLFSTFVEYELNVKHYPISLFYKFLYLCIDCFHVGLVVTGFYLLFNLNCNVKKLMILNTAFLIILLLFFYYKRCILSIYQNKIINKNVLWSGPVDRIFYFFDLEKQYIDKTGLTTNNWIEGNKKTCIVIILLNLYCLLKMSKLL